MGQRSRADPARGWKAPKGSSLGGWQLKQEKRRESAGHSSPVVGAVIIFTDFQIRNLLPTTQYQGNK